MQNDGMRTASILEISLCNFDWPVPSPPFYSNAFPMIIAVWCGALIFLQPP
jgi:hypothetical protein